MDEDKIWPQSLTKYDSYVCMIMCNLIIGRQTMEYLSKTPASVQVLMYIQTVVHYILFHRIQPV